tara:strand:- start:209 stop:310 length:102 start_codon:yes stop_codon:yes gene_type:complete
MASGAKADQPGKVVNNDIKPSQPKTPGTAGDGN